MANRQKKKVQTKKKKKKNRSKRDKSDLVYLSTSIGRMFQILKYKTSKERRKGSNVLCSNKMFSYKKKKLI